MRKHSAGGCTRASIIALVVSLAGGQASAQDQVWWPLGGGTNGSINAFTSFEGDLIAGGTFTTAGGVPANRIARWNGSAWHPLGGGMDGPVLALTVHNGDLIAGGSFTTADGNAASRIARWDGSMWQSIDSGMDADVLALAVFNTELIAGGSFTTAGGAPADRIAKWNGSAWEAISTGMTGGSSPKVFALAVYNSELVAGGTFTNAGGTTANNIARWDGATWQTLGTGVIAILEGVFALQEYGGELVVGGAFGAAGGVSDTFQIARWNGTSWSALGTGVGAVFEPVLALSVFNGELIAGGGFTTAGGVPGTNRIARWDGSQWQPPLGVGMDEPVRALITWNGSLVAGGDFPLAGGEQVNYVASSNVTSMQTVCAVWQRAADDVNWDVIALAEFGGDLIAGGLLTNAGGTPVNSIARWDGTQWHALGGGLTRVGGSSYQPRVRALVEYDGDLVACGDFNRADGNVANGIARWNGTTWSALGTGMGGTFPFGYALAVYNGDLIAGGSFSTAGGVTCNGIARWDGSTWHAMGSGTSAIVSDLGVYGAELFATSGATMNGVTVNGVARWNGSIWQSLGTGIAGGGAADFMEYNGDLIVGGGFTTAGGVSAEGVARWDGANWHAFGGGVNGGVQALGIYDGDLIVGGSFTAPANRIARWTGTVWEPLGTGLNNTAGDIIQFDGAMYVGGGFTTAGGATGTAYLARWSPNEWLNPTGGSYTNAANWDFGFRPESPALFGITDSETQFTVTFRSSADTPELCVGNQSPILNLGGNQLEVFEQTVVGTADDAHLTVNNGTFISPLVDIGNFGTLGGDATIIGDVFIAGAIAPGNLSTGRSTRSGAMTIDGSYEQKSSSTFFVDVESEVASSLVVTGNASFSGTLSLRVPAGELPDGNYSVLSASTLDPVHNRFGLAFTTGLPAGKLAIIDYAGARGGDARGLGGGVSVIFTDFGGDLSLADPTISAINGEASAAVLADLNGDQYLDIAVAIPSMDGVAILLNEGGLGDTYTQLPLVSVGFAPADLVAATLTADASIDVAVANEGSNSVSILSNDGSGNFVVSQTIGSVGNAPVAIAAADFDGAIGNDLAVANRDGNNVRLLDNSGAGSFTLGTSILVGNAPRDVVAVDFAGDNTPDLVVANSGSDDVMIITNDGSRAFSSIQTVDAGDLPVEIQPEDLDNDKDIDLVIVNGASHTLSLIVRDSGSFLPSTHLPMAGEMDSMMAGDVDSDGDADLAVVVDDPIDGRVVQILRNDSTEPGQSQITFALQPDSIGQGTDPRIVLVGDINNDRHADLLTINGDESPFARANGSGRGSPLGSVAVQLNDDGVNLCPADIVPPGGDGQVTIADVTNVLAAYGLPCSDCPQDIMPQPDGDNQVTISDINAVLTAYGPCP